MPKKIHKPIKECQFKNLLRAVLLTLLAIQLLSPSNHIGLAQEQEGPIYIVREGDSLWDIAVRFRVSIEELSALNGITDSAQLAIGDRLIIPGLEGINGILTTRTIGFGDSLQSLSRRYHIPLEKLAQLNHLSSPEELYVGSHLVLFEENAATPEPHRKMISNAQSLLELAVINGTNPWSLALGNQLGNLWTPTAGEVIQIESAESSDGETIPGPSALPDAINSIRVDPLPMFQGNTAEIRVNGEKGLSLNGKMVDWSLTFHTIDEGDYVALQGIHAMSEPGIYTLTLSGSLPPDQAGNQATFSFSQSMLLYSANFPFDPVLTVSPETIDPAVTTPENAQWSALATPVSTEKLWDGIFASPAPPPYNDCWPSRFGNRRSYNGSAYTYFHSGLDFCGNVGNEILAPASGIVVFAGPLTVRGNATMIDHGWGVYTGYLHQSEILVQVGDRVEPGEVIGLVGGTGRVSGPHLHWEVWVGGVQVDPIEWLNNLFPSSPLEV